jgi:DNA repair and recombination RAD54-like protein
LCTARCWRDGQKKKCYLYRFLATGSIEEKVFQRQLSKESLQNVVNGEGTLEQSSMSKEELRRLFTLDDGTVSDTHDCGGCDRCPSKNFEGLHGSADGAAWEEQDDEAVETDLNTWGHHHRMDHVPDPIMRRAAGDDVSFIFSLQVEGCAIVEKEKPKDAGTAEKTAPAPPPASTATRPGGYRLGAGAGGPAGTAGTAGPAGTMRPPAPMRRPLAPVAAKPNVVQAAAGAGRKAPAPSKKAAPPPAKKAKKGKKDDSESEMELDDSESESESEEEEEFESEAEESGDEDEDEEEDDGSGSDEKAPTTKKTTTPARPMRGAAAAAAAILNDPAAHRQDGRCGARLGIRSRV